VDVFSDNFKELVADQLMLDTIDTSAPLDELQKKMVTSIIKATINIPDEEIQAIKSRLPAISDHKIHDHGSTDTYTFASRTTAQKDLQTILIPTPEK
jgi:hypothetical protein